MRSVVLVASAVLAFALTGCGDSGDTAPAARARGEHLYGNAQRGQAYVERWCVTCHTMGVTGSDGAPALALLKEDPKKSGAYIRGFLAAPHKPMPPLAFTNQEIEDIVAYLLGPSS